MGLDGGSIIDLLGEAEEQHQSKSDDGYHFEHWIYRRFQLRVLINVNWDKTVSVAGWNDKTHLDGKALCGRTIPVVANELRSLGYRVEDVSDPALRRQDEFVMRFPEDGFDFKFARGILRIVGVRPLMNGDHPLWPS